MPRCKHCNFFQEGTCLAHTRAQQEYGRPIPPPPIGACTVAIVESYRDIIKPGMRVLEIGCGTWPLLKSIVEENGASYEGIDTHAEYFGRLTIATRIENLQNLSFPSDSFDLVIGNQTIEHWAEFGCDTRLGLFQCFRVCKQGGMVVMNAPIHFHGSAPFLMGNFECIKSLFESFSLQVAIESWGRESYPIPPFFTYDNYPALAHKAAYIVDVRAVKTHVVAEQPLVIPMPVKLRRWLNYPLSFLIHRAKLKLGLARE